MPEILKIPRSSRSLAPVRQPNESPPKLPYLTGNPMADIMKFSGLSDQEISKALGLEVGQVPLLSQFVNGHNTEEPEESQRLKRFRQFHATNAILAAVFRTEKVAEWWRRGEKGETMLDCWIDGRREKVFTAILGFLK